MYRNMAVLKVVPTPSLDCAHIMNTQVCVHILNRDLFTLYHWKFAILTLCDWQWESQSSCGLEIRFFFQGWCFQIGFQMEFLWFFTFVLVLNVVLLQWAARPKNEWKLLSKADTSFEEYERKLVKPIFVWFPCDRKKQFALIFVGKLTFKGRYVVVHLKMLWCCKFIAAFYDQSLIVPPSYSRKSIKHT